MRRASFLSALFILGSAIPGHNFGQAPIEFTTSTVSTGRGARGLVVGDLNGDGNRDLVVMNESDDALTVLLGDGRGGFLSKTNFAVGDGPRAAVLFRRDSLSSLAVAHRAEDTVWILPLDGSGGLRVDQAVKLSVGTTAEVDGPTAIVAADFNADGRPDLATAEIDGDTVSILLARADGSFEAKFVSLRVAGTPAATDADPRSLAVADFNGDRLLDLVTANHDSGTIAILTGDGAGNFSVRILAVGNNPVVAMPVDVNTDGTTDLVVTDRTTGTLIVLSNDGRGNFTLEDEFTVDPGGRPEASTLGDFDGNGFADVIVAGRDTNKIFVMGGDGRGRFAKAAEASVGREPRAVALVDLNKDEKSDIVVANSRDGSLTVLLRK